MIAVDWSHTKGFATYDGTNSENHKTRASFLSWPRKLRQNAEKPVILEDGCPVSLQLDVANEGNPVLLISNKATERYRAEHGTPKSDEVDATIIWKLANSGIQLTPAKLDPERLELRFLYRQFLRYQKTRIAVGNTQKNYSRYYRAKELVSDNPSLDDTTPYDTAKNALKRAEYALMKRASRLVSTSQSKSMPPQPQFTGLADRIWIGILATANPVDFKCKSSYLRFCGLTEDVRKNKNYNRRAKKLYHMLAEKVWYHEDKDFRPIYDQCKADIHDKHPDYDDKHLHYAALIRTATYLAKHVFEYVKGEAIEAGE
jgi:hypothetical protein